MKKATWLLGIIAMVLMASMASATDVKNPSIKEWKFTQWHSDITINQDATVDVAERTVADFTGSFSWIVRSIPKQGRMEITDVRVVDNQTGQDITYSVEVTNGYYSTDIKIYHSTIDEQRDWTISYTAHNVLGYFDNYDELYWNIVSDDRDVPIDIATATVHLPQAVDPSLLQQRLLVGPYGSNTEAQSFSIASDRSLVYQRHNVAPYENMTLVAGWPKGLVPDPPRVVLDLPSSLEESDISIYWKSANGGVREYSPSTVLFVGPDIPIGPVQIEVTSYGYRDFNVEVDTRAVVNHDSNNPVLHIPVQLKRDPVIFLRNTVLMAVLWMYILSPLAVVMGLYIVWFREGRDASGRGVIIPQYEPFEGIRPAISGTVIDEVSDMEEITATIIDLAIRGYITIKEPERKQFEFTLNKKGYASDPTLKQYEITLLKRIFSKTTKSTVKLSALKYAFAHSIPQLKRQMYQEAVQAKFFVHHPNKVRNKYKSFGSTLIGVGIAATFVYFAGIPVLLWGIAIRIAAKYMPRRTKRGVKAYEWAKGFKLYLHHAERYRLKQVTPELFEQYLPYAIVFGVADDWAKHFKELYTEPPEWFSSQQWESRFTSTSLTRNLTASLLPTAASTLSARYTSSGSSSSSSSSSSYRSSYRSGSSSSGSSGFSSSSFSGGGYGGGSSRAG